MLEMLTGIADRNGAAAAAIDPCELRDHLGRWLIHQCVGTSCYRARVMDKQPARDIFCNEFWLSCKFEPFGVNVLAEEAAGAPKQQMVADQQRPPSVIARCLTAVLSKSPMYTCLIPLELRAPKMKWRPSGRNGHA